VTVGESSREQVVPDNGALFLNEFSYWGLGDHFPLRVLHRLSGRVTSLTHKKKTKKNKKKKVVGSGGGGGVEVETTHRQ